MRVCVSLGSSRQNVLYEELASGIATALAQLGHIPLRADEPSDVALSADVLLLLGAGKQFLGFAGPICAVPREHRPHVILWLIEPVPPPALAPLAGWLVRQVRPGKFGQLRASVSDTIFGVALRAKGWSGVEPQMMLRRAAWLQETSAQGWLDEIVTTTRAKYETLDRMKIPTRFAPIGYSSELGEDHHTPRDIDVLFVGGLGARHRRRRDTLELIGRRCQEAGLRFEQSSEVCFGTEREQLVNRAKIFVNLAKYPWDLSIERFLIGMGCGSLMVSEYLDDDTPFEAGRHYIAGEVEELPELCVRWLQDDAAREKILANAQSLIHGELALPSCLSTLLASAPLPHSAR